MAPANALSNWSLSVAWVKETKVLVREVPMLAPMIIGIAYLTSSTEEEKIYNYKIRKETHFQKEGLIAVKYRYKYKLEIFSINAFPINMVMRLIIMANLLKKSYFHWQPWRQ